MRSVYWQDVCWEGREQEIQIHHPILNPHNHAHIWDSCWPPCVREHLHCQARGTPWRPCDHDPAWEHYIQLYKRGNDMWMGQWHRVPGLACNGRARERHWAHCKWAQAFKFTHLVGVTCVQVLTWTLRWEVGLWMHHSVRQEGQVKENRLPVLPDHQEVPTHRESSWEVQWGTWSHDWRSQSSIYQIISQNQEACDEYGSFGDWCQHNRTWKLHVSFPGWWQFNR